MDSSSSSSQVCNPTMNPLFVSQNQVEFTVIRNVSAGGDNLIVKDDVHGSLLFRVKDYPVAIHDLRVLLENEDNPVITLRKRILRMHNQWQIFKGESKDSSELLYTVKSNSMFKSKTKLDIFLAATISNGTCDYKVRGNWSEGSCEVYAGETSSVVATICKNVTHEALSKGDQELTITVCPNVDFVFIISLILVLDKIDRDIAAQQSYSDPLGIL